MTKVKHGDNITGKRTKLYQVWVGMRARCNDPNHISYKNYGAKNIRVCEEWDDYAAFRDWSYANGYIDHDGPGRNPLWIDRIDSSGDYSPENCEWTTAKKNIRKIYTVYEIFGESKTLVEWSEDPRCAVNYNALRNRIQRGWPLEDAVTAPKGAKSFQAHNWKGQLLPGRKPLRGRIPFYR
jgi:hypothetical protein